MKKKIRDIFILSNLNMKISIRVRFSMNGRKAVCNMMKYQIFWSKLLKAS